MSRYGDFSAWSRRAPRRSLSGDVPARPVRQAWTGGTEAPEGYVSLALVANGSTTLGPFKGWTDLQVHGDITQAVYVLVPAPGNTAATTPAQQQIPAERYPLRLPPGGRITFTNTSAVNALGLTVVAWPITVNPLPFNVEMYP